MNYIKEHMKDKDEGFYELQKMAEGYCRDIETLKQQSRIDIEKIAEREETLRKSESKWRAELR